MEIYFIEANLFNSQSGKISNPTIQHLKKIVLWYLAEVPGVRTEIFLLHRNEIKRISVWNFFYLINRLVKRIDLYISKLF